MVSVSLIILQDNRLRIASKRYVSCLTYRTQLNHQDSWGVLSQPEPPLSKYHSPGRNGISGPRRNLLFLFKPPARDAGFLV